MATANIYRGVVYVNPAPRITPSRKAAIEQAAHRRSAFLAEMVECSGCGNSYPRGTFSRQPSGRQRQKCDECVRQKAMTPEQIWAERGGVKQCGKCQHARPRSEFKTTNKRYADGTVGECKSCRNDVDKQRRWANGSVPLDEYVSRITPADYSDAIWRALEVRNATDAWSWWLDNAPEWWLSAQAQALRDKERAAWRARRHIRRARQRGVRVDPISPAILDRVWSVATHCCWCNTKLTRPVAGRYVPTDATIEHIIPLVAGGAHSLENIDVACARCNYSRPKRAA